MVAYSSRIAETDFYYDGRERGARSEFCVGENGRLVCR
jgi:hypothetical protein